MEKYAHVIDKTGKPMYNNAGLPSPVCPIVGREDRLPGGALPRLRARPPAPRQADQKRTGDGRWATGKGRGRRVTHRSTHPHAPAYRTPCTVKRRRTGHINRQNKKRNVQREERRTKSERKEKEKKQRENSERGR